MADLMALVGQRTATRGAEVHDIRARMPWKKDDKGREVHYDRQPNSAWQHTAVHYTAVYRRAASLAAEIASWQGHARHHIDKHGWPGIAYAIGVSLSGRVFLLRDIEEAGFHAYGANYTSVGVCGDMGVQAATPALLGALQRVLGALHEDTPELPNVVRARTWGHKELGFLDARNATTACPGSLLPWVQAYRAGQPAPAPDPINQAFDAYRATRPWLGKPEWRGQIKERAHWGADPLEVLWLEKGVLGHIGGRVVDITGWALTEGRGALGERVVRF